MKERKGREEGGGGEGMERKGREEGGGVVEEWKEEEWGRSGRRVEGGRVGEEWEKSGRRRDGRGMGEEWKEERRGKEER